MLSWIYNRIQMEKEREIIELLVINSNLFSWYYKLKGKRVSVYEDKIEQFPGGAKMYEYVTPIGSDQEGYVIDPKHGLTIIDQREKKLTKILK